MAKKYSILLATASPLYAPLYIAKALEMPGFEEVVFEYHQKTKYIKGKHQDKLIEKLLLIDERNSHVIMAVCDPIRVIAAKRNNEAYYKPLVLSNMIKKMCYWFIDGELEAKSPDEIPNKFRKIIVHPPGMTGYTTAFYLLKKNLSIGSDEAEKHLFSCLEPGKERACYDFLNRFKKPNDQKGYLFSTMNPFDAYFQKRNGISKTYLANDDICSNSIMTALITGEQIYKENENIIDQIVASVKIIMAEFGNNLDKYAEILYQYRDKNINISAQWDIEKVKHFLQDLHNMNIYDSSLSVDQTHLQNSMIIWSELYHHLGTPDGTVEIENIPQFFSNKSFKIENEQILGNMLKKWHEDKREKDENSLKQEKVGSYQLGLFLFIAIAALFCNFKCHRILSNYPEIIMEYRAIKVMEHDSAEGSILMIFISIGVVYPAFELLRIRYKNIKIDSEIYFFILILFLVLLWGAVTHSTNSSTDFTTWFALVGIFFSLAGKSILAHLMGFRFNWINKVIHISKAFISWLLIIPYHIRLFYSVIIRRSI